MNNTFNVFNIQINNNLYNDDKEDLTEEDLIIRQDLDDVFKTKAAEMLLSFRDVIIENNGVLTEEMFINEYYGLLNLTSEYIRNRLMLNVNMSINILDICSIHLRIYYDVRPRSNEKLIRFFLNAFFINHTNFFAEISLDDDTLLVIPDRTDISFRYHYQLYKTPMNTINMANVASIILSYPEFKEKEAIEHLFPF